MGSMVHQSIGWGRQHFLAVSLPIFDTDAGHIDISRALNSPLSVASETSSIIIAMTKTKGPLFLCLASQRIRDRKDDYM